MAMAEPPLIKRLLALQPEFMGYLMAMTRSLDAAEEIFQNVAVAVLESPPEDEIRDFRAWAKEVVRRQALLWLRQQVRSHRRHRLLDDDLQEAIQFTFDERAGEPPPAHQDLVALRRCLAKAPARMRELLLQRYQARASFAQIAAALGGNEGAVQRALSRARLSLRDCLRALVRSQEPA
jgi:RNA polymerase sigma-70 factor (ECF subfamily)